MAGACRRAVRRAPGTCAKRSINSGGGPASGRCQGHAWRCSRPAGSFSTRRDSSCASAELRSCLMGLLDGKVAIVTGGGRGLGRAHALRLTERGAAVVVNEPGSGLHGEPTNGEPANGELPNGELPNGELPNGEQVAGSPADLVAAEITAAGGRAVADYGSVTDWSATEKLVNRAVDEFGHLDIVVNNAGLIRDLMLFSMNEQDFDEVIAVHLKGTFAMTRHACAYWRGGCPRAAGRRALPLHAHLSSAPL